MFGVRSLLMVKKTFVDKQRPGCHIVPMIDAMTAAVDSHTA